MEKIGLAAGARDILGKKVRFLRRKGITPVHVFGHSIESLALQCDTAELKHALTEAGRTKLIGLKTGKAKKPNNVVVREIQKNPLTGELLHVDFYQVKMEEKIRVEIPIVMMGEAPALKLKENILIHELNILHVECLPDDIPSSIQIDITSLAETDDMIRVKDIVLDKKITVLDEPEQVIMKIAAQRTGEIEEEVAEEVAEAPETAGQPEEEKEGI